MEGDEEWQSTADASFLVAEYRKPEFEVKVTTDKTEYINGEEIILDVDASYFFGAPVNEAPVEWRVTAREYVFADPKERGYIFTDYDLVYGRDYYEGEQPPEMPRADGAGTTDAEGKLELRLPADVSTDPTSQVFSIEATVSDINHQQVSGRAEVVVHKGMFYIGLRPRSYVATAGEAATLDILTLDTEGEIAADVPLTVSVYQRKWTSVKERDPSGEYYWRSEPEDTLVETLSARTGADGEGTLTFAPPRGGSYRLVAEAVDAAGNRIQSATYLWVAGSRVHPLARGHRRPHRAGRGQAALRPRRDGQDPGAGALRPEPRPRHHRARADHRAPPGRLPHQQHRLGAPHHQRSRPQHLRLGSAVQAPDGRQPHRLLQGGLCRVGSRQR